MIRLALAIGLVVATCGFTFWASSGPPTPPVTISCGITAVKADGLMGVAYDGKNGIGAGC